MKKWLVLAVLLASAGLVFADMTIVQKIQTSPMMGQPAKNLQMTMYIKGQKARIELEAGNYQILDLKQNKMFIVDPSKKTVMVVNPNMMQQAGKMMTQMNGGKEPNTDIQKTGKSDTVNGFKCDEYSVNTSGGMLNMTSLQCISKDIDTAEFEPFRQYAEGFIKVGGSKTTELKGLPVRSQSKISMMGQTMESKGELLSVSTSAVADTMFTVPPDFKMMEMPSMPEHKPQQ
jgi:uncharacterized protein DUF4412